MKRKILGIWFGTKKRRLYEAQQRLSQSPRAVARRAKNKAKYDRHGNLRGAFHG